MDSNGGEMISLVCVETQTLNSNAAQGSSGIGYRKEMGGIKY